MVAIAITSVPPLQGAPVTAATPFGRGIRVIATGPAVLIIVGIEGQMRPHPSANPAPRAPDGLNP